MRSLGKKDEIQSLKQICTFYLSNISSFDNICFDQKQLDRREIEEEEFSF